MCSNDLLHSRSNHEKLHKSTGHSDTRCKKQKQKNLSSLPKPKLGDKQPLFPVSWINCKTISMTCRRSTVGRVKTVRQGLRIAAGSE